tara:strand:+ start:4935 stop:5321 length:387 start_codon:yes stop_codon:yes gene_type:complete
MFESSKTSFKNCNCWTCVQKSFNITQENTKDIFDYHKWFISHNLYNQQKSDKDIKRLTENIGKLKPNWNNNFIQKYIISRYPDYYFYNKKLKENYQNLTIVSRERFRIKLISEKHLCEYVIKYIQLFI